MEIRKHFPIIGIISIIGLLLVALVLLSPYLGLGDTPVAIAAGVLLMTTLYKVKSEPACHKWEEVLFYIFVGFVLLTAAAALQKGDKAIR